MIDIHSHLLPGIDDGASDLAESVAMCRAAADDGCTAMVATPHVMHEQWWNGQRGSLERLWHRLRDAASEHLEVFLGSEIAVNSESCQELQLLPGGELLSLAGSRYVLLEFHPRMGPDPEDLIYELTIEGWIPIIAHPERIRWLAEDLGYLAALSDLGAMVQVTAMSVTGELGRYAQAIVARMLDDDMVDFVASDAHDTRIRRPGLGKAYRHIAGTYGEAKAHEIFFTKPRAVLKNHAPGAVAEVVSAAPTQGRRDSL